MTVSQMQIACRPSGTGYLGAVAQLGEARDVCAVTAQRLRSATRLPGWTAVAHSCCAKPRFGIAGSLPLGDTALTWDVGLKLETCGGALLARLQRRYADAPLKQSGASANPARSRTSASR
jgi:hypothetical protein